MEATRNLCAQIPVALHDRVRQERETLGQSLSEYVTQILKEHFEGGKSMSEFETLWYNGSSRRGIHYDSTRYHALNLHSVFSNYIGWIYLIGQSPCTDTLPTAPTRTASAGPPFPLFPKI